MALMWPRQLPLSIRQNPRRYAEVRTFDRLQAELEDDFTVFYSSPWLGEDRFGAEKDGECDFLVAHARLGFLAIEVKGGGISFEPENGQWKSRDRNHFIHNIKDPVEQARSAKHAMLVKLKESRRWQERFIHVAHGVIFPDASSPPKDLGADRPARIFCCSREFTQGLRGWIGTRLEEGHQSVRCQPLGADGVAALTGILAAPFQLHFPVSALIADAAEQMGALEPSQFHILDHLVDVPRAEIRGGAGTGKTVIAAEEACRQAKAQRRVLLTCFSAPLAAELSRKLDGVENLTVASFHSLCGQFAAKAGLRPSGDGPAFFNDVLPDALMDAAKLLPGERFDAVIVDEGQDFRQNWWIALTELFAPSCQLRVLSDANQRVYGTGKVPGVELELVPIRLTRNLRNTKPICLAAAVHYDGPELTPAGPDNPDVKWIEVDDRERLAPAAVSELRRLVFTEDVAPSDIAVLVPAASVRDDVQRAAAKSRFDFVDATQLRLEHPVLDTVRRFKGLERPAVILVVGPGDILETELAYVGFTRPKAFLAVVACRPDLDWLRGS